MSNVFKYPKMDTVEQLDKAITGAIESAKTMKLRVQYAAIGCMIMAGKEGQAELAIEKANYLVDQLGNGIRGDGLVKFMVYMCGFVINPAVKKDGFIKVKSEEWIRKNLEAAKEKAWEDYAPSAPYSGFDLDEQLQVLVTKADNALKIADGDEKKAEKVNVDREMLEIMVGLLRGTPITSDKALKLVKRMIPEQEDLAKAA